MRRVVLFVVLGACTMKGGDREARKDQTMIDDPKRPADTGIGRQGSGAGGAPTGGVPGGIIDLEGSFEAVGSIDKDTVRKVVKDNVGKLQTCYEQTLMANPDIAGTVTATFSVDNGNVINIKAAGVHPDVEACVVKAVQQFKFPPGTKVDITYPFNFKPAS